jgi:hypothetical protein
MNFFYILSQLKYKFLWLQWAKKIQFLVGFASSFDGPANDIPMVFIWLQSFQQIKNFIYQLLKENFVFFQMAFHMVQTHFQKNFICNKFKYWIDCNGQEVIQLLVDLKFKKEIFLKWPWHMNQTPIDKYTICTSLVPPFH